MRVDGLSDVGRVSAHLHRETDFADEITGMRSDDAATDAAMGFRIEKEFGEAFVAAIGNGAA